MKLPKIRKIIGTVIILILFYFLGKSLYQNWHTVATAKLRFHIGYLSCSFLFMGLTLFFIAYVWKLSLAMLKERVGFFTALRINALAILPKYAPGKIWGIIGKVYLAKKDGISQHSSVITISLETILYLLSGVILFLLTASSVIKGRIPYLYYLILIPICLIITYPKILIAITNFSLRIFKRQTIDIMPKYSQILKLLGLYLFSWVIQGVAVYFLIKSFYPISINYLMVIAGLHAFSWVVGFVSIITPAGLGIKESVLSYFLAFIMPSGVSVLIALVSRLWIIIGEIIYFLVFIKYIKKYL